jgi:hypothetical protein
MAQELLNFDFFVIENSIKIKNQKFKEIEFHTNIYALQNYLTICVKKHLLQE